MTGVPSLPFLPIELRAGVLKNLDSYEDLRSAIQSSRSLCSAFYAYRKTILGQIVRNLLEPEAYSAALAVHLCPRNKSQFWDASEKKEASQKDIQDRLGQHIDSCRNSLDELPFPGDERSIADLYRLTCIINWAVDRWTEQSWQINVYKLDRDGKGPTEPECYSLTRTERARLQTMLFRWELLTRTVGLSGGDYPNLPTKQIDAMLDGFDGFEMQQLLTIDNWVLADYRHFLNDFEASFMLELRKAAAYRAALKQAALDQGAQPMEGYDNSVRVSDAVMDHSLPYFLDTQANAFRQPRDQFIGVLQSLGLTLYRHLCEGGYEARRTILTSTYTQFLGLSRDWLTPPFQRWVAMHGCPLTQLIRRRPAPVDDNEYPNDAVRVFIEHLRDTNNNDVDMDDADNSNNSYARSTVPHDDLNEVKFYLQSTGWWFWSDARVTAMGIWQHRLFVVQEPVGLLHDYAEDHAAGRLRRHTAVQRRLVAAQLEVHRDDWLQIADRYRLVDLGTGRGQAEVFRGVLRLNSGVV
ncbi:Uu.00g063930.m01.CDS01 [Anthostomella pinea]|uniref:Uu.00g063930.m01.CDS01 n=1 Tax=Anthostomella pinea TaxID=933095 RepID=A0AAI8VUP9_9PEZI|nr:Uu.00g063930.m01.CDS01 [Anthostomella pinea]